MARMSPECIYNDPCGLVAGMLGLRILESLETPGRGLT